MIPSDSSPVRADAGALAPRGREPVASDTEQGALERFIESFQRYEVDADLFNRSVDGTGFAWWDVARYSVQMTLCTRLGIVGRRAAVPRSAFARVAGLTPQVIRLARDLVSLFGLRRAKVQAIVVYGRPVHSLFAAADNVNGPRLWVANAERGIRSSDVVIAKRSVDLLLRIGTRLTRPGKEVVSQASEIDSGLRALFGVEVDIRSAILDRYRHHLASSFLWQRILKRAPAAQLVGYVNDDTLKTLVALAGARGTPTLEFQHGYMGHSNVAFAYPLLQRRLATIPDKVMVDWDSGDISYPATRVSAPGPVRSADSSAEVDRVIDVLIGGSPTRNSDAVAIATALVGRGLAVTVKLHPAQTEESTGLRSQFSADELAIAPGVDDFRELVARSKIFVPANPTSSTAFQAVELGAKLVVVDYDGVKLTSVIDHLVSGRVGSVDQLPQLVAQLLSGDESGCAGSRHSS